MVRSARQLDDLLRAHEEPALLVDAASRRIIAANHAAARVYGYRDTDLRGLPIETLWPGAPAPLRPVHAAESRIARHRRSDGQPLDLRVSMLAARRARGALEVSVREVSQRAFSLALLESQCRILEQISRGASLEVVLRSLVRGIEALSGDMLGSVLLLSEDGRHVRHGAAPSLPSGYWQGIEGQRIGPAAGSCGTAMYLGRQVVVPDIATSPLWHRYRTLALTHGLRACWSTPIFSRSGDVLGAFALYYREPRKPGEHEQRLVQLAAELAAIAIERHAPRGARVSPHAPHASLSAREMQILRLIAHGDSVKRIASKLHVSISTVYTYRVRIFEKLGLASNVGVARYAVTHRLVS